MAHDERQTSDDDAIYDAVYRDFDRELSDLGEGSWSETIGLLSGRSVDGDGYRVTRAAKLKRLREVLRIAARYDILHGLTPQTLRSLLEELGPTFVKAGQILSMRSEILPQSFCDELTKLRTDVEPMDRDTLIDTLRAEYDEPLEDLFDAIDDVPLGSASVAQVHKARLITGELVAVKVQRPHVQELMAQDISIIRSLARRAQRFMGNDQFIDLKSVIDELWVSFRDETDFLVEARSLQEFRRNNANVRFVDCPKPYPKLCTRHVVVMDYVDGIPIGETDRLASEGYDLVEIGTKLVDNYAQQMLDDGFFHADPHPGNLVIQGGKIIYLDLGIMGRLTSHDRAALRDMIFAVGRRDAAGLKDGLLRFSLTDTSEVDHAHLLGDLDSIIDEFGDADLSELDVGAFLNNLISMARKSGIELPGTVTMLARSLITLEGVVDEFLPGVSIIDIITQHVRTHLDASDFARHEAERLGSEVLSASHGLLGAASQADLAMSMLTRGQLRMNLDLAGTEDPMHDVARAADRLTMGIIIAGLFIGSSVVYYARIKPVIFGIPVIGFIGYLVALGLGLSLVRQILHEGQRRRRR
ncbi:MAG: AarF/ABC1/UbiB kinase family protein [Atopobiaceae bacterium]|nr:AarF/ABC1/UbiB kinase family protein [Atopobiaceae bacterium]